MVALLGLEIVALKLSWQWGLVKWRATGGDTGEECLRDWLSVLGLQGLFPLAVQKHLDAGSHKGQIKVCTPILAP